MPGKHDLRLHDLRGKDLSAIDTTGYIVAHGRLDGCKFKTCKNMNFVGSSGSINLTGIDITGATFWKADQTVLDSLIGAVWNGVTITHVSHWLVKDDGSMAFCTNAFCQFGCMTKTISEWKAIGTDINTIRALLTEQPDVNLEFELAWWNRHKAKFEKWHNDNGLAF